MTSHKLLPDAENSFSPYTPPLIGVITTCIPVEGSPDIFRSDTCILKDNSNSNGSSNHGPVELDPISICTPAIEQILSKSHGPNPTPEPAPVLLHSSGNLKSHKLGLTKSPIPEAEAITTEHATVMMDICISDEGSSVKDNTDKELSTESVPELHVQNSCVSAATTLTSKSWTPHLTTRSTLGSSTGVSTSTPSGVIDQNSRKICSTSSVRTWHSFQRWMERQVPIPIAWYPFPPPPRQKISAIEGPLTQRID